MDYHDDFVRPPLGRGPMRRVEPVWLPDVDLVDTPQSDPARSTAVATPRAVRSRLDLGGLLKCQRLRSP